MNKKKHLSLETILTISISIFVIGLLVISEFLCYAPK